MKDAQTGTGQVVRVRRYPNRRYYDATHSQHVTLEGIYQLILDGHDVEVTDSKTDDDITARVLTQIILEHETPKLVVFPVGLLHRLIRANEPLVREFVDKYFSQAFSAFVDSQRQFSDYLRDSMQLGSAAPWQRATWGPSAPPFFGGSGASRNGDAADTAEPKGDMDLRETVKRLQEQMREMKEELNDR